MKKVAVIGRGYVGKSVFNFFKDHFEVLFYDPNVEGSSTKEECNKCDLAVVCVPTPMAEDYSVDLSIVNATIDWLETPLILIKSTIPPTTTAGLISRTGKNIAFSPEMIGEGKYEVNWWQGHPHPSDMKLHYFHIIGGEKKVTRAIVQFFLKVGGPSKTYTQTDSLSAEIMKYTENIWGAMKVTWANEMYQCCENLGADWAVVRELWALDGRVDKMHTAVFEDNRGWSGKCYPKDLVGFIKFMQKISYEPELLKEIVRTNARFSSKEDMKKLSKGL